MIGLLGSMLGGQGGRMLGRMIGGRTGAMVGGMVGSMLAGRQLARLGRSVGNRAKQGFSGGDDDRSHDDEYNIGEEKAEILVRVMVNSAKSDGHVDDAEARQIVDGLGDEVSDRERAFLESELRSDLVPVDALVRDIPADLKAEAYAVSLLAINVDTMEEAQYLRDLSAELGMSADDVVEIHRELGVEAPT